MNSYVIVDIDGVVADCTHRLHLIKKEAPDWDGFFFAAGADAPIWPMIRFIHELRGRGIDTFYMTGRPERIRPITSVWLRSKALTSAFLTMREDGDHRPDHVVKREAFLRVREVTGHDPIAVFEDRDQVVEMWRELGLLCLQPKKGDY